jgi:hypothetical protein
VPSPTAAEAASGTALVIADQGVNVRGGPGTTYEVVTVVSPGVEVTVIGRNADGSWINIRLEDGTEGWMARQLLLLEDEAAALPNTAPRVSRRAAPGRIPRAQADPTPVPGNTGLSGLFNQTLGEQLGVQIPPPEGAGAQPEATEAAAPTEEAGGDTPVSGVNATPTPILRQPGAPSAAPPHVTGAYPEARWYAVTLGIIVSAVVIGAGAIFNLLRSLFRRGR